MAKRYGKLPHEVLALEPFELAIATICMGHGQALSRQMIQRITSDKGMVFPVVVVGG